MLKLAFVFVAVFAVSEAGFPGCEVLPPYQRLPCVCGECILVNYKAKCKCSSGWTGALCNTGPCDTAPNQPRPCGENGVCQQNKCAKVKTCECKHGYTGKHCQISPCAQKPDLCKPCGHCNNTKTRPYTVCDCKPGWTGVKCQSGPCAQAPNQPPCGNNGDCVDRVDDKCADVKKCDCKHGYFGDHCEKDPCQRETPKPCDCGTCEPSKTPPRFVTCTCFSYFGGPRCDQACKPRPPADCVGECRRKGDTCNVCCNVKKCFPKPH